MGPDRVVFVMDLVVVAAALLEAVTEAVEAVAVAAAAKLIESKVLVWWHNSLLGHLNS